MSIEQEPKKHQVSPEKMLDVVGDVSDASKLSISERVKFVLSDPACKEAYQALARTLANVGITAVDMIPGAGDAAEGVVLGMKLSPYIKGVLSKYAKDPRNIGKHLDLTPDIKPGSAVGISALSAPLEFVSGGTLPSYLVNTLFQLRADLKNRRFDGAIRAMRVLLTGKVEKIDAQTRILLDNAAKEFTE
jgi:hypothetical protein